MRQLCFQTPSMANHDRSSRLLKIITEFSRADIVVIGDVLLDSYVNCKALGIANEAPVPLLELASETHVPGGAGNVAVNLARLGVKTHLVGIRGADSEGAMLERLLEPMGVDLRLVITDAPTPHKSRFLSDSQYYLRLDEERVHTLTAADVEALTTHLKDLVGATSAIVLSDYEKGTLSNELYVKVLEGARKGGVPIFADLKPGTAHGKQGFRLINPNLAEAHSLVPNSQYLDSPAELASRLSQIFHCDVLLKMSAQGLLACKTSGEIKELQAECVQPKNVSGGGDTVLSAASAALAVGADLFEAATLANHAAAIAVAHPATYAVSRDELQDAISRRPL